MTRRPAMAGDPLVAALDAAREKGCVRAVLITETQDGIAMHVHGEWSGLELRGLGVFMAELQAGQEEDEGE
jgi:hypothetical protein